MAAGDAAAASGVDRDGSPSPWKEKQFEEETRNPLSHFWVLREQGELTAFGGFWLVGPEAQLANIGVRPDHRRRGAGRALLRWLMRQAALRSARRMTLEVRAGNAPALRLYRSENFLETSRRPGYYEGRETAVLMERKLDPKEFEGWE